MFSTIILYIIICILAKNLPYKVEHLSRYRAREDEEAFLFTDASDFHF